VNKLFHKFLSGRKNRKKSAKLKSAQFQTQMDKKLVQNLNSSKKFPSFTQLKYLKKFLSKKESNLINFLLIFIIVCVLAIGVNVYWINSIGIPADGGEYTEGLIGSPQFINPILSQTNDVDLDLSYLLFTGLMRFDPEKGLQPDLAESFEISDDQKTYTFYLRRDLFWDDSEKLTADDVLFTVDKIKNPKTKSPLIFNFSGVGVEKIDEHTIKFVLEEPFAPFLESLTFGILPQHKWSSIQPENFSLAEYNLKPTGNGPFKVKSIIKERTGVIKNIVLIKNELYHREIPKIEKITFKFYPDFMSAIDALNNKKIEGISYLPQKFKDEIFNSSKLNFHKFSLPQYIALFINQNNNELLKNKKIRQVLALSIDRDQLLNAVYENSAKIIYGPVLPGQLGYTEDIKKYEFNNEQAKKILNEAGWQPNDYKNEEKSEPYPFQVRKKDDKFLEITLTAPAQTEFEKIAKQIQQYWQRIGIKTNLDIVNPNQIQREKIKNRDFQILLYGEILGADPDPYPFWHSSQCEDPGLNLSCFRNAKADELLEKARQTTSIEERQKKYIEFQKIIAEEVPAVFLFNTTYTYPITKKVKGLKSHQIIMPAHRFAEISSWYVKTKRIWSPQN